MPTYLNSSSQDKIIISGRNKIELKSNTSTELLFYIPTLPEGVTITSHSPLVSPWDLIGTVTSVPSEAFTVSAWSNIIIYNKSDGIITVSANGDSSNAMVVMPYSKEIWDNSSNLFGSVTVLTNEGNGNVYIWGSK